MRYAKVVTDSLAVHDAPGGALIGYLPKDVRVKVVRGPIPRNRTWWLIDYDEKSLCGWVADGDGKAKWLALEPPQPAPPDRNLPELPDDLPVGTMPIWLAPVLTVAVIGAVALLAWLFG